MNKNLVFMYGIISFLLSNIVMLYFIGFIGNFVVPKTVNSGIVIEVSVMQALIINTMLIALFGLQHSIMARQKFKQWWQKIIPAPMERSTYMWLSSIMLILLYWQWQPLPHCH